MLGGVAMMVFGAGLDSLPTRLRAATWGSWELAIWSAALPDLERYLKLRAM